ncbi:hypothetical protein B0T17DRAFT_508606 [Bombardia bombarda]|uniref:Uncharacterized protein n=1 Tax=Bombardia bombarda TaxID=252184 RepID=A0AA39WTC3_9PEZI|nr:hypothetical protein B0T17DRAFT_508606 [Bombardia bombarda]
MSAEHQVSLPPHPRCWGERAAQLEQLDLQGGWVQVPIERDELQPYVTTMAQREAISLPTRRVTCFNDGQFLGRVAAKNITAVNALLAYSHGQLSVAPCTDCAHRYERYGSARPFPDCVFLPGKWGFACASCIARGIAAECSLHIPRQECLDESWGERIDNPREVLGEGSRWLDRGHPLGHPEHIWVHRSEIDGRRVHDLAHPAQEPSFVHPSEVPGVRLPGRMVTTSSLTLSAP